MVEILVIFSLCGRKTASNIGLKKVGLDIETISCKYIWALVPAGH
jgi:hypothetical protein